MRAKLILCGALTLVLASATASLAQQMQYDRTGDHMFSYGPVLNGPAPSVERHPAKMHPGATGGAQIIDRTADHMLYYGPVTQ